MQNQMEQYFARQTSNCCQLNFSNTLVSSPRYIISPKKNSSKPLFVTNKSAKKSLKAIHSHHTSKDNKNQTQFQFAKAQKKQADKQLNDYGQLVESKNRTEKGRFQNRKQLKFQALDTRIKQFRSQQKTQLMHSPNKPFNGQQFQHPKYPQKSTNFITAKRQQQLRGPVLLKTAGISQNLQQKSLPQQTIPQYYCQIPNHQVSSTIYHPADCMKIHQIPTYARSPIKINLNQKYLSSNPYTNSLQNIISTSPSVNKLPSTNYSQNFKKIYGEVQIEDEIKHDLMVSLEFSKNDYQLDNGVSRLTKCPPSQDSTILPPESKLKHKFQYQIDSFRANIPGRKSFTEKCLKGGSFMGSKQQCLNLNGRQKFKSIVSVESQHSSSQGEGAESVIIDHHPQSMLSANPIKSLL